MNQFDAKIPDYPDQTSFLERWHEWHRGYEWVPDGRGQTVRRDLIGERLDQVSNGRLPRSLEERLDEFASALHHTSNVPTRGISAARSISYVDPPFPATSRSFSLSSARESQSHLPTSQNISLTSERSRLPTVVQQNLLLPNEDGNLNQRDPPAQHSSTSIVAISRSEVDHRRTSVSRELPGIEELVDVVEDSHQTNRDLVAADTHLHALRTYYQTLVAMDRPSTPHVSFVENAPASATSNVSALTTANLLDASRESARMSTETRLRHERSQIAPPTQEHQSPVDLLRRYRLLIDSLTTECTAIEHRLRLYSANRQSRDTQPSAVAARDSYDNAITSLFNGDTASYRTMEAAQTVEAARRIRGTPNSEPPAVPATQTQGFVDSQPGGIRANRPRPIRIPEGARAHHRTLLQTHAQLQAQAPAWLSTNNPVSGRSQNATNAEVNPSNPFREWPTMVNPGEGHASTSPYHAHHPNRLVPTTYSRPAPLYPTPSAFDPSHTFDPTLFSAPHYPRPLQPYTRAPSDWQFRNDHQAGFYPQPVDNPVIGESHVRTQLPGEIPNEQQGTSEGRTRPTRGADDVQRPTRELDMLRETNWATLSRIEHRAFMAYNRARGVGVELEVGEPGGPSLDRGDDRPPPKTDEELKVCLDCKICYAQLASVAVLPCGNHPISRFYELPVGSLMETSRPLRYVQVVCRTGRPQPPS